MSPHDKQVLGVVRDQLSAARRLTPASKSRTWAMLDAIDALADLVEKMLEREAPTE